MARTLIEADGTPGAQREVDRVLLPLAELLNGLFWTGRKTIVTFKADTAGKTPVGFISGLIVVSAVAGGQQAAKIAMFLRKRRSKRAFLGVAPRVRVYAYAA